MAKDHLHDRQRDVALHQFHRPRPADDLRSSQFARHPDGLGLLVEFSARMGRIQLEQTPSRVPRGKGFHDAFYLGRHPFRYLHFAVGPVARTSPFSKQDRVRIGIEVLLRSRSSTSLRRAPV